MHDYRYILLVLSGRFSTGSFPVNDIDHDDIDKPPSVFDFGPCFPLELIVYVGYGLLQQARTSSRC